MIREMKGVKKSNSRLTAASNVIINVPVNNAESPAPQGPENISVSAPPSLVMQTEIDISPPPLETLAHCDLMDPDNLLLFKKDDQFFLTEKNRKVKRFYKAQNELIEDLLAPIDEDQGDKKSHSIKVKIAIFGSLFANIILAGLQLVAARFSGSIAIIATMSDALMDLLSGLIIIGANYLSKTTKTELYLYPIGKSRFETVGIIIFGCLMSTVALQIIIDAVKRLISPQPPEVEILAMCLMGVAIGTKFGLYLYCRLVKEPSVNVLAQDHRNDILLNSVGIAMAILSDKLKLPYLDPIGAIFVALVMFRSWTITILHQGKLISGKAAGPSILKRMIYISMMHDDKIVSVESCRAYHCGEKVMVEVDIVLPPDTTLNIAHDLGESLQGKLERLGVVERAFVHVDYNVTHEPEHQAKVVTSKPLK